MNPSFQTDAEAEAAAVATATAAAAVAVSPTDDEAGTSEPGFSSVEDGKLTPNGGAGVDSLDVSTAATAGTDADKDNDVEGKLFIGGISWQTTEEGLRYHFGKFGTLADVALMKDKYTGHPRGFGFIKFEDASVLDPILAKEHKIDGKIVDVKRAVPKSEAPGPSRSSRPTETNKIFVGGLAPTVTMAEFRKYFESFGGVVDAVVMFDRQTQRSRGFGFVTFQEDTVVQNVLMVTHEINGKMVEVKRAEPKENRGRNIRAGFTGATTSAMVAGGGHTGFSTNPRRAHGYSGGRGTTVAGYGLGGTYGYGSSASYGPAAAAYNAAAYGGYAGYGYNGQAYTAAAYGYGAARGVGTGYGAETVAATGTYGASVPSPGYAGSSQEGISFTQAEYAVALRGQQQAQQQAQQHPVQHQVQLMGRAGESSYGSQPY
ncbi:unnamed protein product [Discosporangium mesarthrocarpum]